MGKSTISSGQPIFNQLLTFIDKSESKNKYQNSLFPEI